MKLNTIAFIILILFAIVGYFFSSNLIHESSHKQDFKGIADPTDDSICLLEWGGVRSAMASYNFWVKPDKREEYKEVSKFTEYKAYSFDILILAIFSFCFYRVVKEYIDYEDWRKFYR